MRKLGERVLPLIIPILSRGLKDPDASRRQVILYFSTISLATSMFFFHALLCIDLYPYAILKASVSVLSCTNVLMN